MVSGGHRTCWFQHSSHCEFLPPSQRQAVVASLAKEALGNKQRIEEEIAEATPGENKSGGFSLDKWSRKAGRDDLKDRINFSILKLLCNRGLPPTVVDSEEWKNLLSTAAPKYKHCGLKTFVDSLIPQEYALIKTLQLEHLKACKNLTISFDGQTSASLQSVYTVHVITGDRRIFFYDGNEASDRSHTGEHIFNVLNSVCGIYNHFFDNTLIVQQTIMEIGPERFRGITSDNTGNTSVARKLICNEYPWIIILPDPCHRLNLLCKDIAKIEFFYSVSNNSTIICVF